MLLFLDVHVVQRSCGQAYTGTGEGAGRFQTTKNYAWSASTAVQLALCTGERRDRASQAWKVVGQIKEPVVLPEVRNWHGKASIFGQPYSQGVWGLRFVKRTREDPLHRSCCKGFAQAPCPVSRPTGRVHIIGHQSRLHRKSIQATVQSGVKESVRH